VFSLCSEVYVCIEATKNVPNLEKFGDLYSVWHCHCMEEIQAAAALKVRKARLAAAARKLRKAEEEAERAADAARSVLRPVDLTEDNDPGGSNSNSESSLFDSE